MRVSKAGFVHCARRDWMSYTYATGLVITMVETAASAAASTSTAMVAILAETISERCLSWKGDVTVGEGRGRYKLGPSGEAKECVDVSFVEPAINVGAKRRSRVEWLAMWLRKK